MAFGLPIAVAIGWTLAAPPRKPAQVGAPGSTGGIGAGALGAAPDRATHRPDTVAQYSSQPPRPGISSAAPSTVPTIPVTAASGLPTPGPSAATSEPTLPPLTLPPVPTPTEIPDAPSTPPSPSPTDEPSGSAPTP